MIKLRFLNKECKYRTVANTAPIQVLCRILGTDKAPCPVNKLCKIADKHGIEVFYTLLAVILLLVYIIIYWILNVTKLKKPVVKVCSLAIKPVKSLIMGAAKLLHFVDNLPC